LTYICILLDTVYQNVTDGWTEVNGLTISRLDAGASRRAIKTKLLSLIYKYLCLETLTLHKIFISEE